MTTALTHEMWWPMLVSSPDTPRVSVGRLTSDVVPPFMRVGVDVVPIPNKRRKAA